MAHREHRTVLIRPVEADGTRLVRCSCGSEFNSLHDFDEHALNANAEETVENFRTHYNPNT